MHLKRMSTTAACAAVLLAGLVTPAAAATPEATAPAGAVAVAEETKSTQEIVDYWTPERIERALANPAPVPVAPAATSTSASAALSASDTGEPQVTASADAVSPKNTTKSTATSTAASSAASAQAADAAAADIAVAQDVPASTSIPNVVVGKLFFTKPDGSDGSCSGSVIVSDTANTVWTAGHCVHLGDNSGDAGWYSDILFIPGYKDGQEPWGVWVADRKYAPTEWLEEGDSQTSDMAAVVLAPSDTYGNLQDNIGALGYQFGSVTDYDDAFTVGYPGEGYNRTDMDGEQMMFCYGNTEDASPLWPLDDRLKMDCDMGRGASGGPMFIGALGGNPQIVGANSHYEADATTDERLNDDLFSSTHDDNAVAVINAVNDSV
jgi:V8-like Glu-specific endopeptidase